MPRSARNLDIFLYMPRFMRSVRMSAKRQTLHSIYYFAAQAITQCFRKNVWVGRILWLKLNVVLSFEDGVCLIPDVSLQGGLVCEV